MALPAVISLAQRIAGLARQGAGRALTGAFPNMRLTSSIAAILGLLFAVPTAAPADDAGIGV